MINNYKNNLVTLIGFCCLIAIIVVSITLAITTPRESEQGVPNNHNSIEPKLKIGSLNTNPIAKSQEPNRGSNNKTTKAPNTSQPSKERKESKESEDSQVSSKNNSNNQNIETGVVSKSEVLRKYDLKDKTQRLRAFNEIRAIEIQEKQHLAQELKRPENKDLAQRSYNEGNDYEVAAIDPISKKVWIHVTHDIGATISANAQEFEALHNSSALDVRVGIWDSGSVNATHQEISPRATPRDGATLSTHASQVAGCIASFGIVANAKAIASRSLIDSYDWNFDYSEMVLMGAASENDSNHIGVSNHSYSYATGWYRSGSTYIFTSEDDFGQYGVKAKEADEIAHSAPYYLVVRSAGNDRSENPAQGAQVKLSSSSSTITYNSEIHPKGDGVRKNGYDTISHSAVGKNVLTIGAVEKAVLNNQRNLARARMTSFSAWGPTDDGRIKPDLVASGSGIYTINSSSSTSYTSSFSGTSAAAPIATSLAAALIQRFRDLSGKHHMLASTLKAILIATADDLGAKGPDYVYGHGHINGKKAITLIENWLLNPEKKLVEEDYFTIQDSEVRALKTRQLQRSTASIEAGEPIKIAICWTDPAATSNSTKDSTRKALVNDLEIRLVDEDGNTHMPYVMPYAQSFNNSDLELPAIKSENSTDNVEVIEIDSPNTNVKNYTLQIFAKSRLVTDQKYSLILIGVEEKAGNPLEDEYTLWLETNFGKNWQELENTSPTADFDEDGQSNAQEFYLGTDPKNEASRLKTKIINFRKNSEGKTILTIRVDPVINLGTTQLISTFTMETENTNWDGPSLVVPHNPNSRFVDVDVEILQPQQFFKAIFNINQ